MGNCGSSVNCTAVDQPVEGNPDVAGIGVLVSFLATAVVTFMAIVVGYLSDSLPDTSLTQLDRACIIGFSSIRWRLWVKDGPISVLLRRSKTIALGVFGWDSAVPDHDKSLEDDNISRDAPERRSKGLERFILALSDQQLVTGLAVLIAGFVSPCSMSMYHFNIIAALGWFSSTTHLSTLAALRVYFIEHPRLRNWRVVAMLLVLALLIVAQVITSYTSTLDNSLPLRCTFTHHSSRAINSLSPVTIAMIIIFLGVTYTNRIVRLYVLDPQWSLQARFADAVVMTLKNPSKLSIRRQYTGQELVKIVIQSSNKNKAEQSALWGGLNERRRYSKYYYMLRSKRSGPARRMLLIVIMMTEINYSFLGDLCTLQFGVTIGLTQVIATRIDEPKAGIVGSQNQINFGQLVPLLLMLLPLFAAGEVYFGNKDNLYALGLILIVLSLERRDDMLTKLPNNNIRAPNQTHRRPFFSQKFGLADFFELSHSSQLTSDNTTHAIEAYSFLQSPGSVSSSVVGSNLVELQNLPTVRLRRPDTETGLRAPTTDHSELAGTPSRNPVPEIGIQPAKATKKPPSVGRFVALLVGCIVIVHTLLAIDLGGVVGPLSLVGVILIVLYSILVALNFIHSIYQGLEESRNS